MLATHSEAGKRPQGGYCDRMHLQYCAAEQVEWQLALAQRANGKRQMIGCRRKASGSPHSRNKMFERDRQDWLLFFTQTR